MTPPISLDAALKGVALVLLLACAVAFFVYDQISLLAFAAANGAFLLSFVANEHAFMVSRVVLFIAAFVVALVLVSWWREAAPATVLVFNFAVFGFLGWIAVLHLRARP